MSILVRELAIKDFDAWHALWAAYCDFYETEMPLEVTETTWQRLMAKPVGDYFGLVVERDGVVVGIANCVLHHTTWAINQRCYLNDLFVAPEARGSGAGKALIQHLQHLAATNNWDKVHWLTHESNDTARRLYDQFEARSGFIQYAVPPMEQP